MTCKLPIDSDLADALIDGAFNGVVPSVQIALNYNEPALMRGAVTRLGAVGAWAEALGVDYLDDLPWPVSYADDWRAGFESERDLIASGGAR